MADHPAPWANRIIGHGTKPAGEFLANPLNYRLHPQFQQQATEASLEELGWIRGVLENARTGRVIDGHLRVTLALRQGEETPVPYDLVDLDEQEEALALAILDPLAALAATDEEKVRELLDDLDVGSPELQAMLDDLRGTPAPPRPAREHVEFDAMPEHSIHRCPSCGYEWEAVDE